MDIQAIHANLSRYVDLPLEEVEVMLGQMEEIKVFKRDFIVQPGQLSDTFYWVMEGCMMAYVVDENGDNHVMQFAQEWWWTAELEAFTKGNTSTYHIRCMEDATLLALRKWKMEELLREHPKFEKYYRIIFQNALITHQRRIIHRISLTAEDRYERFIKNYPNLELKVPQKYIASYLGMTPEFLSKLKRKRWEKLR
ncbi:MAG: Crp/Fnr family transcriptional regulator [Flavobacteriales bacterium]|nr:Crp/Fnr family transcriptional regulator [Flavobacteriales bacterium]